MLLTFYIPIWHGVLIIKENYKTLLIYRNQVNIKGKSISLEIN